MSGWQINLELRLTPRRAKELLGVLALGLEQADGLTAGEFDHLKDALTEAMLNFDKTGDPRGSRALVVLAEQPGGENDPDYPAFVASLDPSIAYSRVELVEMFEASRS